MNISIIVLNFYCLQTPINELFLRILSYSFLIVAITLPALCSLECHKGIKKPPISNKINLKNLLILVIIGLLIKSTVVGL